MCGWATCHFTRLAFNRYTQPKPSQAGSVHASPHLQPSTDAAPPPSQLRKDLPQDMGRVPLSLPKHAITSPPRHLSCLCMAPALVHNTGLLMRQEDRQLAMEISAALLFLNSQPVVIELMERFFRLGQVIHPLQPTLSLTADAAVHTAVTGVAPACKSGLP